MENKHNQISAEITVSYDYDRSSWNFEEMFKKIEGTNVWQYIDYGNIKLIDNITDLVSIDKSNSRESLLDFLEWTYTEGKDYTKKELRQEVLDQYPSLDDIETIERHLSVTKEFITTSTRGYSQGDYADVLIPTNMLRECWGTPDKIKDEGLVSQEYIDNLFWDSPLYGSIEIFASQNYLFELHEVEEIPEYLNYPQDIDFVNEEIMKFIGNHFKNVPALQNILDAVRDALPSEIEYPKC